MKNTWLIPVAASLCFALYTAWVVLSEGPFGFLGEHARTGWGIQVFIDLALASVVALTFVAASARRYGIAAWPYVVATCLLGSIGLLVFVARVMRARAAFNTAPTDRPARASVAQPI